MLDITNPTSATSMFTITGMMEKIDVPGVTGQNKSMTCFTTGKGSSKCFEFSGKNSVKCKDAACFVAFQTLNQRIIGSATGIKRLGLDALMVPNGISTRVVLVGEIDKKKLGSLKRIIGDFKVEDVDGDLPRIHEGFPQPPGKCHLNPFSGDCSMYLSSDDWAWIPGIGLKRSIEIATNPKTLLKSEVVPELKKFVESTKQLFKKPTITSIGNTIADVPPMRESIMDKGVSGETIRK
jgi:hypothetical protein